MKNCIICKNNKLDILTEQLRNSLPRKVFYCSHCQLGILEPKKLDVKKYYKTEYRKKYSDNLKTMDSSPKAMFELRKRFQNDRIGPLKKYFDNKKTLLEIGCSAGQFLVHVKKHFKKCTGIELDTKCADFVEKKLDIKVYRKELEYCGLDEKSFDFIAAFQVLEHTINPVKFLRDIRTYLKDNGKIFIEIPNLNDALLKIWPIKEHEKFFFHEAHTFYFTLKSLQIIFHKAGFKIELAHFTQDYNILNHLYWYFVNAPQPTPEFGLSRPHIEFSKNFPIVNKKINQLFQETDMKYKKILTDNKVTSNILIIASKK